jgi:hypothetical protein
MRWLTARQGWQSWWLILSLVSAVASCAHSMPENVPVIDRVLGDPVLREQLVATGTLDEHFVHEVLHQLGQGPRGDHNVARLLADHLHHHPTTARAVYGELVRHKAFQEWLLERVQGATGDSGDP